MVTLTDLVRLADPAQRDALSALADDALRIARDALDDAYRADTSAAHRDRSYALYCSTLCFGNELQIALKQAPQTHPADDMFLELMIARWDTGDRDERTIVSDLVVEAAYKLGPSEAARARYDAELALSAHTIACGEEYWYTELTAHPVRRLYWATLERRAACTEGPEPRFYPQGETPF